MRRCDWSLGHVSETMTNPDKRAPSLRRSDPLPYRHDTVSGLLAHSFPGLPVRGMYCVASDLVACLHKYATQRTSCNDMTAYTIRFAPRQSAELTFVLARAHSLSDPPLDLLSVISRLSISRNMRLVTVMGRPGCNEPLQFRSQTAGVRRAPSASSCTQVLIAQSQGPSGMYALPQAV